MAASLDDFTIGYRFDSMAFILLLMQRRGTFERYGLNPRLIDCCMIPACPKSVMRGVPWPQQRDALVQGLVDGTYDFMCGFHSEPYLQRYANKQLINIAQTANTWTSRMFVRPGSGITSIGDLPGRRIGMPSWSTPEFNPEVYLRSQHLETECDGLVWVPAATYQATVDSLKRGEVDATFIQAPDDLQAEREGLEAIPTPPMYTHWYVKLMTTQGQANRRPDRMEAIVSALAEGVQAFCSEPAQAIGIMQENWGTLAIQDPSRAPINLSDPATVQHIYQAQSKVLNPSLLPDPRAIANICEVARRQYPDDELVANPLQLWDTHFALRARLGGGAEDP